MLRVVVVAVLAVVSLDVLLLALAFEPLLWLALPVPLGLIAFVVRRRPRRRAVVAVAEGWPLGQGTEITDPHSPVKTDVVLPHSALDLGVLILGAPGAGKSEACIALLSYLRGTGWCYGEGKGDTDIYKKLVAAGARPDHFFSSELPGSDSVNLMEGEAFDVIDRLSRMLIGRTASTDYYTNRQRNALTHVVPLLLGMDIPVNLRDLYAALALDHAGAELVAIGRELGAPEAEQRLAEQYFAEEPKSRREAIGGLLDRLFVFVHGPGTDRVNCYQPDISMREIVANGRSLYLHLPLSEFAKDLAVAFMEMLGVEARRRQQAGPERLAPYRIICDDWGDLFHENFTAITSRARSARMPFSFGFQSRAQLAAVSPVFEDTLDDTVATKVVMRVMGERTVAYGRALLGQHETTEVGTSELGDRPGTTLYTTDRDRVDAQALRSLAPGEAYISTLVEGRDVMRNALYKVRLPRAATAGWQDVALPASRDHAEGTGLGLWSRHMDNLRLATRRPRLMANA